MADNINIKDGSGADKTLATKEVAGVHYSAHVLYDASGNPVDFTGPTLIGGTYNASPSAKTSGTQVYAEMDKYGAQKVSLVDGAYGTTMASFAVNGVYATRPSTSTLALFSGDAILLTGSIGLKYDAIRNGYRKDALPSEAFRIASSAATDNATLVKSGLGPIIKRVTGYNAKNAIVWLKIYDKATAPTSADTPKLVYALPATSNFNISLDDFVFQTGIGVRLVTGAADNDTGALAVGDILNLLVTLSV